MKYETDPLLELCHHLFPYDFSLREEVRLSIRSPLKYMLLMKNQWPFSETSIQKPLSNLPWFALLSGLAKRQLLFSWNDHMLTPWHLNHTESKHRWAGVIKDGRWNAAYPLQEQTEEEYELFLKLATQWLTPFDYVLCEFTPSFVPTTFTILERDAAHTCKRLAQASGYGNIFIHHADDQSDLNGKSAALVPALLTLFSQTHSAWTS